RQPSEPGRGEQLDQAEIDERLHAWPPTRATPPAAISPERSLIARSALAVVTTGTAHGASAGLPGRYHHAGAHRPRHLEEAVAFLEVAVDDHRAVDIVNLVPPVVPVRYPITRENDRIAALDDVRVGLAHLVLHFVRSEAGGAADRSAGQRTSSRH